MDTRLRPPQLQAPSNPEFQRRSRKHGDPGCPSRGLPCPRADLKVYSTNRLAAAPNAFGGGGQDARVAPSTRRAMKSIPAKLLATLAEAFTFGRPKVLHDDG